ncbi:MAG TPA: hypothetical protein VF098_10785 [Sphingomicrobium sp.]|jgi:hypothetical protein
MKTLRILLPAVVAAMVVSTPALADGPRGHPQRPNISPMREQPLREQERAFEATRDGRSMPLPQLERRIMPMMGGADYLGPEMNGDTYRFKFMQNGRVIWVDVDGRGNIIRRSHD